METTTKNKAIKYRIYPNSSQIEFFEKSFGCCRKIWNLMLSDKKESYKKDKTFIKTTPAMYKKEYPYLKEVDSLALANIQLNLEKAIKSSYDKKRKKLNGFPKFKSKKKNKNSYTTNNQKGSVKLLENHIKLPKIGLVKIKIHRKPKDDWLLKSATISKSSNNQYFISVLFEYENTIEPIDKYENVIGLDYKSNGLYMDSNGNVGTNHKFFKKSQKKLAKAQRKLSKKKGSKKNEKKSKNYLKQLQKVNNIQRKIANQRLDNLHKISNEIANHYDVVCVEDLNMQSLANKGFKNGRATLDNGYGIFLNMLDYKLLDRGKYLIKVSKWFPSTQTCSCCGNRKKIGIEERTYICSCGNVMDRDINAAINIKNEGLRILEEKLIS